MSLEHEVQALIGHAEAQRRKLTGRINWLTRRTMNAQALFLDDKGELRPEAVAFFSDIAREAGMNREGFVHDPRLRDFRDGGQYIVRYVMDSLKLDARRLRHFQQQLNKLEKNNND